MEKENQVRNYKYLVVFEKNGELSSNIVCEGFIPKDEVEETIEMMKRNLMEDYDGYELFDPIDVMKKGSICSFDFMV